MAREKETKEERELRAVFKNIGEEKRGLIEPLLTETIDLKRKLEEVKKLPLFTIGKETKRIKRTEASKLYTELLTEFNFCIKNLSSFIKREGEEESPLETFIKNLGEENGTNN